MGLPINLNTWDAQPSLSADGRALYFSSERKSSVGGKDIFVSYRNELGAWGLPQSVGDSINSLGDDQAPFIHPDGQTLYFTSDGHPNFGKRDLFFSRLHPNGKWGKPQNLGYPINTKESEGTLIVSLDGKMAYFTKSIEGGKHDLYQFELYEAARPQPVTYSKITVTDALTGEPLRALTEVQDVATQKSIFNDLTDAEGNALICMTIGKNYSLEVSKDGYLFYSENFNLSHELKDSISIDKPVKINIKLRKIGDKIVQQNRPTEGGGNEMPNRGEAIILKNVFFEIGSAALRPESTTELMRLKQLLEKNNSLNIEIQGHTDNVGNDRDNQKLSENRAKAVYNFLISQGIVASRLSYRGFGESQPIAPNDTPQGRLQNRRTAFIVK
jgi:outer membrane protein OmpA-like peptidoglycan-associated protein